MRIIEFSQNGQQNLTLRSTVHLENIDIFAPTIGTPAFYCVRIRGRSSKTKTAVVTDPYISRNVISPCPDSNVSKHLFLD